MTLRPWLPPIAWAAFILVLTSIPGAHIPRVPIQGIDKVVHLFCYGVLAFLTYPPLAQASGAVRAAILVMLAIAIFGALDEWHQQFIPGRTMDLYDWFADTLGAFLGLIAAIVIPRRAVHS